MIIENKDKKTAVEPFWQKESAGQRLKAVTPSYLSLREKTLSRREGEKVVRHGDNTRYSTLSSASRCVSSIGKHGMHTLGALLGMRPHLPGREVIVCQAKGTQEGDEGENLTFSGLKITLFVRAIVVTGGGAGTCNNMQVSCERGGGAAARQ